MRACVVALSPLPNSFVDDGRAKGILERAAVAVLHSLRSALSGLWVLG